MPNEEYQSIWYPKFGIDIYHANEILGTGISVYIVDTGINGTHRYGLKRIENRSPNQNAMFTSKSHGSFVVSILAKSTGPVLGLCPDSSIYLYDANDSDGNMYTSNITRAVKDATRLKVDILSISLGTNVYDKDLESAILDASNQGILIVAASGNCGCRSYEFPAAFESVIAVGSIDKFMNLSPFNTRNDSVMVFGPGQDIQVTGTSKKMSGTSFAVPFISGLLALELQRIREETSVDKKLKSVDITMTRLEAIRFLRNKLHLKCGQHTYVSTALQDICTSNDENVTFQGYGSFEDRTNSNDSLFIFTCLAIGSGVILLLLQPLVIRSISKFNYS